MIIGSCHFCKVIQSFPGEQNDWKTSYFQGLIIIEPVKIYPIPSIEIVYRSDILELKPAARRPILMGLIVSQLSALDSLVFWLFAAGISVMAFDSELTPEAWTFVIAIRSYPIWPIIFTIAARFAYTRKKDRLAGILTTLTLLPMLLFGLQNMSQDSCA